MTQGSDDPRVYEALMIPADALEKGGVEILRAGLVEDMLNVHAIPAFDDPKHWGDVLAEIAEALADLYPDQPGALEAIQARFLIECGREVAPAPAPKAPRKPARKAAPKSKSAKTTAAKAKKSKTSKTSNTSKTAPRRSRATSASDRKSKRKR